MAGSYGRKGGGKASPAKTRIAVKLYVKVCTIVRLTVLAGEFSLPCRQKCNSKDYYYDTTCLSAVYYRCGFVVCQEPQGKRSLHPHLTTYMHCPQLVQHGNLHLVRLWLGRTTGSLTVSVLKKLHNNSSSTSTLVKKTCVIKTTEQSIYYYCILLCIRSTMCV